MKRSEFIKAGCAICVLGALGMMPFGADAHARRRVFKTEVIDNKIEVPFTEFAETNVVILRIKKWDYDVAVEKSEDNTFNAVLLKCTHMDNGLYVSGGGYICSMHGSEFDRQGTVLKGPAETPLTTYNITPGENSLIINIQ